MLAALCLLSFVESNAMFSSDKAEKKTNSTGSDTTVLQLLASRGGDSQIMLLLFKHAQKVGCLRELLTVPEQILGHEEKARVLDSLCKAITSKSLYEMVKILNKNKHIILTSLTTTPFGPKAIYLALHHSDSKGLCLNVLLYYFVRDMSSSTESLTRLNDAYKKCYGISISADACNIALRDESKIKLPGVALEYFFVPLGEEEDDDDIYA